MLIAMSIALVAALIGGATMAWFSYKVDVENTFTAGHVMIEESQEVVYGESLKDNVNPGDAFKKCIPIFNIGSKNIRLRMSSDFDLAIDWDRIRDNWEELCFTEEYDEVGFDNFKADVLAALESGNVTNPADAVGEPDGPFDEEGDLVIPMMVAPTPDSGWVMKDVDGQKVFFYDGVLRPDYYTVLCMVVVFDGPWMGNLWQGATLTLKGTFEAIQSSNDAPENFWGEDVWDNYIDVIGLSEAREQLEVDFSEAYVNYFYDGNVFRYAYLCELPPESWYETAFAGDTSGDDGRGWWYYFDMRLGSPQTIWAGQHIRAGSASIVVDGEFVKITLNFDNGWGLEEGKSEAVKIKGYYFAERDLDPVLPTYRPPGGVLRDYKGTDTEITLPNPDPPFDVYVIHLDVQNN